MMLQQTKIYDKNDLVMSARLLVYNDSGDTEKIRVIEIGICGLCKSPVDKFKCMDCCEPICDKQYCPSSYDHKLCIKCALQRGHAYCVSCDYYWANIECVDCNHKFCASCHDTVNLGHVCRDCRIKQGCKFCETCNRLLVRGSLIDCQGCSRKICDWCSQHVCESGHRLYV